MNETKDGGPAFPRPQAESTNPSRYHAEQDGMSLRDYFAAHAPVTIPQTMTSSAVEFEIAAIRAYRWADALLAERNRT